MQAHDHSLCPVYDSIQLLQEKWVLHIIRALLSAPHGFNELARAVGGVNTTTLAARLDRLEREGIVSKAIESTMPPRTRYDLTDAGVALQDVIEAIDAWAREHMPRCHTDAVTSDESEPAVASL
jgi:DNA-binding HxlR family transcriptional regulator